MPRDEQWAVADNSWIQWSTFSLNGHPLEFRKKLHYGKDLPIDLTPLVTKGENILDVSVMSNSDDHNYRNYLIAAEFLGVMTRQSIDKRLREKTVDAQTVIGNIKRKLSGSLTDNDEIVLMESTLTVNLRDPFSASKICDTPVRGKTCLHNDCFDLDTFLETRPKKVTLPLLTSGVVPYVKQMRGQAHLFLTALWSKYVRSSSERGFWIRERSS